MIHVCKSGEGTRAAFLLKNTTMCHDTASNICFTILVVCINDAFVGAQPVIYPKALMLNSQGNVYKMVTKIYINFVSFQGLWSGVVNTTNVDMVNLYDCTYDQFNLAATMKSIGVMGGSFFGAAISDRFRPKADLFLAIVCCIGGIAMLSIPWSPNLIVMGVLFIINGLCHGISNVGKCKSLLNA